jgi:SET domain-containing protein
MLLVKTRIGPSTIEGVGLFADEFIPKGKRMWALSNKIDTTYTGEEVQNLAEPERSDILGLHYSYLSKDIGRYVICGDDARFINHSDNPNMVPMPEDPGKEPDDVAARDIQKGEEITYDYREFGDKITFVIR